MNNVAKYWPAVRQAVYGILAAVLAGAAISGKITQDQADSWLATVTQLLGAIGFVVAGLFVDKTSSAQEVKIERAVEVGLERAAQRAQTQVNVAVDQATDLRERFIDPFIRR